VADGGLAMAAITKLLKQHLQLGSLARHRDRAPGRRRILTADITILVIVDLCDRSA
jgi:hypothetical protein